MYECPDCGKKADKDDVEYTCPFCSSTDVGEGFYTCENCGALFDFEGNLWECEFCHNDGITEEEILHENIIEYEEDYCPECGEALEDSEYCIFCGWPNNQGWIGENYG